VSDRNIMQSPRRQKFDLYSIRNGLKHVDVLSPFVLTYADD